MITIEKPNLKKPFIGGYRNKVTGLEYHHAAVQTMPKGKVDNGVSPFHWCYIYYIYGAVYW